MRWVLAVLLTCATAICAFAQTWTERELDLIRSLLWEAIERGGRESSRVLVAPSGPPGDPLAGK